VGALLQVRARMARLDPAVGEPEAAECGVSGDASAPGLGDAASGASGGGGAGDAGGPGSGRPGRRRAG
jgi:hypothetical protein